MSNKLRLKKIERELKMEDTDSLLTYGTILMVDKERSFEETIGYEEKSYSLGDNRWINIFRGKEYIGRITIEEKPEVKKRLKEIYNKEQAKIKNDPNAGLVLVWVTLRDTKGKLLVL